MTTTLIVNCDRCGCEILHDRTAFDVRCGPLRVKRESLDWCAVCLPLLREWLQARPHLQETP